MNIYATPSVKERINGNSYVGRGIIVGKSADASKAVFAYFIMGRSENSRNRIFVKDGDTLFTRPYDESKVVDPSLIIYAPVRVCGNNIIVTNGDQTDTVEDFVKDGESFSDALATRCFEPDGPNFTPRISAMLTLDEGDFTYQMSILKSADAEGSACNRFTYSYAALPGVGHFLHTYVCDGNPIPTFQGEPERVEIGNDIAALTAEIWDNLDANNKISLYVRYTDVNTGAYEDRLINKYSK